MRKRGFKPTPLPIRLARMTAVRPSGCHEFTGSLNPKGYGQIRRNPQTGEKRGRRVLAHRAAYEIANGVELPDWPQISVLHRCDNPCCINPEHLFLGSQKDNIADMIAKGRAHRGVPPKGEDKPNAKLSEDDVRAIRADRRPIAAIAEDYGVSGPTAHRAKTGNSWRHVV